MVLHGTDVPPFQDPEIPIDYDYNYQHLPTFTNIYQHLPHKSPKCR